MCTVKKEVEVTLSVENLVDAIETMVAEKELCGADRNALLMALCPSRDEIIDLLRLEHENENRSAGMGRAYWTDEQAKRIVKMVFDPRCVSNNAQLAGVVSEVIFNN